MATLTLIIPADATYPIILRMIEATRDRKMTQFVLLIPDNITQVKPIIQQSLQVHGLTEWKETEPKAGCRRFELT